MSFAMLNGFVVVSLTKAINTVLYHLLVLFLNTLLLLKICNAMVYLVAGWLGLWLFFNKNIFF